MFLFKEEFNMWNRSDLKSNAKLALKANYWKAVLVGLILSLILGSGSTATRNSAKSSTDGMAYMDPAVLFSVIGIILAAVLVALVISILLSIFIWNPLEVGCQKFFVNCKYGNAQLGDLAHGFKNGYANIGVIMFLRGLFTALWSLLFIIPGIVKSYEYMMIPYLLAEHPEMTRQEAFAESKRMMDGNKWNAFVLDLSFIGWTLLGICTVGILLVFYVEPYIYLTHAELYHALKNNNKSVEF